jgi:hypothetical protein
MEDGDSRVVRADTNLFVAVGAADSQKYDALRDLAQQRGGPLRVPERVREELRVIHLEDRLETAVEQGWATLVEPPQPTAASAVATMDFVRQYIADQTGADEHDVQKADTVFAGLAVEYIERGHSEVIVLTDDKIASAAIERAVSPEGCKNRITVYRRADILDTGDDFRVI